MQQQRACAVQVSMSLLRGLHEHEVYGEHVTMTSATTCLYHGGSSSIPLFEDFQYVGISFGLRVLAES